MWQKIKALFVGVGHDPQFVAAFRQFVLYVIPVVVTLGYGYAEQITNPVYYGLAMAFLTFVRSIEGVLDRVWKRDQNAINPPAVAGGADPDILR